MGLRKSIGGLTVSDPGGDAAEKSYLTLTGMVISFAVCMTIGWLVGGTIGMWVGAALNLLRYGIAIWRAAYAPVPPEDGGPRI